MNHTKRAVLHVALNPVTGPWTVMRSLAKAQNESGQYCCVAIGVIASGDWPAEHASHISECSNPIYLARTPKLFGTASFLYQRLRPPPIGVWIDDMVANTGCSQVVVHFHNAWMSGVYLPLRRTHASIVVVATVHGFAGQHALSMQPVRRLLHYAMAQRLLRYGARLTSVESGNLPALEQMLGLPAASFSIVPNGLEPQKAHTRPFVSGSETLTVAQIGALTDGKGWRIAADAVVRLSQQGCRVRMLIAGNGSDESEVRMMAQRHPECLQFLGMVKDPVNAVLPDVDILTLASSNDGLPMAILEALMSGIPVISTRVGGIPDAIHNEVNGFLIERSVDQCYDRLLQVYRDRELLRRLSDESIRVFNSRFEISKIVDQYEKVYTGLPANAEE